MAVDGDFVPTVFGSDTVLTFDLNANMLTRNTPVLVEVVRIDSGEKPNGVRVDTADGMAVR